MSRFNGIWVSLVTPFAHGQVDHPALRQLVISCANAGAAGVVALGTTGEPSSLDELERTAVLSTVLESARSLPVVAGLAGNNVTALTSEVAALNKLPLAGLLVPAPYYIRPSQQALSTHFTTLADASAHPVIIYDIPYRTGVHLETATLLSLAQHPNIQAVKDCGGSLEKTLALILDKRLSVLAGEDLNIYATLCLGGNGAISAGAHVRTNDFVAMYDALNAGRLAQARERFHKLVPLIQMLFEEPNPAPLKAALASLDIIRADVRLPLLPATDALRNRLSDLLADLAGGAGSVSSPGMRRTLAGQSIRSGN